MSDHFDTQDPRTDITDLYLFHAPGGGSRSVLVLDVNPDASTLEDSFDPDASYELKIDTDGDLEADVAFHVLFASSSDGGSTATVYRSTDAAARGTGPIGEVVITDAPVSVGGAAQVVAAEGYRFFAGLRSDPHFKDVDGFLNDFRFTGHDAVADRNVFGIVLEVPNAALGTAAPISIWARTMAPVHGNVAQLDQAGRPGINNTFNRRKPIVSNSTKHPRRSSLRASATGSLPSCAPWATPRSRPAISCRVFFPTCSSTTRPTRAAIPMADVSPTIPLISSSPC